MNQDRHPGWGQWFAAQWGLFVAVGIVVGFALWLARHSLMVGLVLGCFAFVIGCIVGVNRLDKWLEGRQ
jgi:hypothetical protein